MYISWILDWRFSTQWELKKKILMYLKCDMLKGKHKEIILSWILLPYKYGLFTWFL